MGGDEEGPMTHQRTSLGLRWPDLVCVGGRVWGAVCGGPVFDMWTPMSMDASHPHRASRASVSVKNITGSRLQLRNISEALAAAAAAANTAQPEGSFALLSLPSQPARQQLFNGNNSRREAKSHPQL